MRWQCISALLMAAALPAACGGGGGGVTRRDVDLERRTPPLSFTQLPDMPFEVAPGAAVRLDFELAQAGDLAATIDWRDPANNLVAVFTSRGCHSVNDALAHRCSDTEVSEFASTCPAKPRVLVHSNYAPVALRLWIANTGATAESGDVALTQCVDAPDCGATGSCMACFFEMLRRRSCAP
jgi:hypothetical protein